LSTSRPIGSRALVAAFVAACFLIRLGGIALAEGAPLKAQVIDVNALTPADFPTPEPGPNSHLYTKAYVDEPGAVVRIQIGTVPKHYHIASNEIQYVVAGTGTEWLGSKRVALKPGLMLIIPKGVAHGGLVEMSGHLKMIIIKTPPQRPTDNHPLP
jgi:mannose-6-phosphate isomerase-like protein (cupin superfamily)